MQYSPYGVTGRLITCFPFCYLSRSPVSALANRKVTEVTGKYQKRNFPIMAHAHGKNRINSDIAVTSVTPVTYYLISIENTDSTEVTGKLTRRAYSCYPDFSHAHALLREIFSHILKSAFFRHFQIHGVKKHSKEAVEWTR